MGRGARRSSAVAEPRDAARVRIRSTTVLAVRHQGSVVLAADGQVTLNGTVVKNTARKVRRLGEGRALAGFAGSAADGITLLERFEAKLEASDFNLRRAAVDLAKDWRTDKLLRRLEALMIVADRSEVFLISGTGDVIQPDDGVVGIGSGGGYALAAARALLQHSTLGARAIAEAALGIAAGICIYTNRELTVEELS
ncbi:MAG: ATP-dependent protease subunit HslV [Proteobacteria bacterium]|nr:ATP-dependent protease subunit HslV [Pseudomonadota bacterium]